jgi:hypothetical protein
MQILQDYGSLDTYNEEQRRCGFAQIEAELFASPGKISSTIEIAPVIELNQPIGERQHLKLSFKTGKLLRHSFVTLFSLHSKKA